MLKREVTYEDFNGDKVTETLYFNISKSEIVEMQVDGISELLAEVTGPDAKAEQIIPAFKKIIGMAYGAKSDDGRRFHKDPEQTADFLSSPAYDTLFVELITGEAIDLFRFVQAIMPADLVTDEAILSAASQAGLKVDISGTAPATTQGIQINSIKLPDPATPSTTPAAFQANGKLRARERERHGHSGDPRKRAVVVTPQESVEPKPLNEMTEEELRAELQQLRSN